MPRRPGAPGCRRRRRAGRPELEDADAARASSWSGSRGIATPKRPTTSKTRFKLASRGDSTSIAARVTTTERRRPTTSDRLGSCHPEPVNGTATRCRPTSRRRGASPRMFATCRPRTTAGRARSWVLACEATRRVRRSASPPTANAERVGTAGSSACAASYAGTNCRGRCGSRRGSLGGQTSSSARTRMRWRYGASWGDPRGLPPEGAPLRLPRSCSTAQSGSRVTTRAYVTSNDPAPAYVPIAQTNLRRLNCVRPRKCGLPSRVIHPVRPSVRRPRPFFVLKRGGRRGDSLHSVPL